MPLPLFVASRTFDPRRIPGLQAWYDAADSASVTLDAGRVSQWSDKSGNARHATNTTSGSTQPSYTTAGRNGLNVLTFAAASVQRLTVAGTSTFNFLHNGTESWWVAVSKYATTSNPQSVYALLGNNGGSSGNVGVGFLYEDRPAVSANNGANISIFSGVAGTAVASSINTGAVINADYNNILEAQSYVVQECVFAASAATLSQRIRLRVNGGTELASQLSSGTATSSNASFAMQLGAAGNNAVPLQGDICELMFFNQQPTASARDLIRRYLGAKWGVTVA